MAAVFAVLVAALAFGLCLAPSAALAEGEASLGAPEHEKTITDNGDGTYTLTLDVTGATDSSSETVNKPVDIVLVVDQSSSMNDNDRMENVRNAAIELANSVLADNGDGQVRISVVLFGTYTQDKDGNTKVGGSGWLTSANQVANEIPSEAPNDQTGIFENGNGTNWEAGLREANNIISSSDRPDAEKYVIFLSDGQPTYRLEDAEGHDTGMIETWAGRFFDRTSGKRVYWIRVPFSDGYFSTSPLGEIGGGAQVDTKNVEFVEGDGQNNPNGGNSDAALPWAKEIVDSGATFFSVSAESGTDDLMRLFHRQVTGSTDGFYSAGDADSLNKAFEDITSTILREASYRNVVITDTLSEYVSGVTSEGDFTSNGHVDPSTFEYKRNGATWEGAPKASVDDYGVITWDFGEDFTLDAGVTYSVSFRIAPNQDAFDAAAAKGEETNFPTNGQATVSYEVFKTVNGEPAGEPESGSEGYGSQQVPVPVSTLTITKEWVGEGTRPESVTVQVMQDDANYGDAVTLSAENGWTANVTVPAGPKGHTYTVVETSGNGAWTPSYAYAVADGSTTSTSDNQGVTLRGTAAQSATATVTNTPTVTPLTLQDILHVTKTMRGHALEEGMFDFTVTAVNDVSAAFAGFTNGNTLTLQNGAAAMGEPDTVHTGNQLTFDYDDLGVTYAYEYRESPTFHEGYELDGVTFDKTQYRVELTAQKVGDSSDIQVHVNVYTREGDTGDWGDPTSYTVTKDIMSTTDIKIAFENTYTPLGLTVKKVNQDGGALTGAKFTLRVDNGNGTYNETTDAVADYVHDNVGMTGDALTGEGIEVGDDSTVSFYGLEAGKTYWIVETYAPTGYQISEPYKLEVSADGATATFYGSDGAQIGNPKTFSDRMVSINFKDRGLDPIPETGGIGNVPLYVGGILAVAGSVVISRKGRANG
ncbi:DUF7604 domain-containing protein [Olsenella sp. An188]|uniref:DUF7604 domain-containing protein n=1 Tax=Olsenella sp. An188 TaxID=1965579 RepID=UPI00130235D1|nr:VWA domain-containing protein [Olsenella sp. An188]